MRRQNRWRQAIDFVSKAEMRFPNPNISSAPEKYSQATDETKQ